METAQTIDVRGRPCACCREDVLRAFDGLRPGEALELLADRDPTPLWYRFELRWTGRYRWIWLRRKAGAWRVRIERHAFDGQPAPRFDVLPRNPGCPCARRRSGSPQRAAQAA